MVHLKCHMGDGLPATAKLSCSKPALSTGGESNISTTPPPTDTTAQESATADPDGGIGGAQLSDGFSNYMKGGDAANQLLKLREWQLEKWGKNFSRHRASFGKSPGVLELSPVSGRMHRSSPPVSVRDLVRDRRPSSQNSCYTPRSDVHSHGRSIDSVERFHSSATPLSAYGNASSVDASDHSICPQSADKEVSNELALHSPAQAVSASYAVPSLPPEQTVSSPVNAVALAGSSKHGMPSSPLIAETELLPKNVNYLGCVPPKSSVSCDVNLNQQPSSVASPSLYVLSAQEVASCSLPPSKNEFQGLQEYSVCSTEFTKHSNRRPEAQNSAINVESYGSSKLPLLGTVDSDEFSEDVCTPAKQYHELQPLTGKREHPQSLTALKEPQSITVSGAKLQPVTANTEQLQSVTANEEQPQSFTLNRDLLQSLTLTREQQQSVSSNREEKSEPASGMSELWVSCPSNQSTAVDKPSEISSKPQQQGSVGGDVLIESQFSDIHDNFSNRNTAYSCWSPSYDEGSFHTDIINSMTRNISSDDTLKTKSNNHFHDSENTSAFHCSGYESQAAQEDRCEELCSSSIDTKPYLHKKFHHDQERKVLPSAGVDQVADVSQYINSFQSVLVRKLNGTLSTAIPMTSNICSTSIKTPEKEVGQEGLEQPHQTHQPQIKEYTCEVCHQKYKNLATFKLHCKDHKKEDKDFFNKNLKKESLEDPLKGKRRKKESFQCDQCSKVFPKAFNFARHMREVHAVKKSFMCLQCNKAFSSKRHLQEHSGIHKSEKVHECPQCHHLCYTATGLRTHIQEIHSSLEQQAYYCDICGEKFAKVYGLKRHKQRKHIKQQLTCHVCAKTFSCKEDMTKHSKTHISAGTLKCDSCDKTFTTSWALQRHSKSHQNSPKNFTCSICNLSFTRKDSLVSHRNAHAQKKPFVCHCGKRFVKKSQLKEHQDKHSTIPKYTCLVCKHSFKFKVSLKNHSCKKKENSITIN